MVRISREQWPRMLWLVALALLGVAMLLFGSFGGKNLQKASPPTAQQEVTEVSGTAGLKTTEEIIEARLKAVLRQIHGAGEVEVSVTLAKGPEYRYAVNTNSNDRQTEEADTTGGKRTTTEKGAQDQLVMRQTNVGQDPVIIQETKPEIQGVLVLAQGADDIVVRAQLIQAAETLLGVAPHQLAVMPKE